MVLRKCLADHYSPVVGEVAAGDVVDLPDEADGAKLAWSDDYWGDPDPPAKVKIRTGDTTTKDEG